MSQSGGGLSRRAFIGGITVRADTLTTNVLFPSLSLCLAFLLPPT
jgi:hypothetical protein